VIGSPGLSVVVAVGEFDLTIVRFGLPLKVERRRYDLQ